MVKMQKELLFDSLDDLENTVFNVLVNVDNVQNRYLVDIKDLVRRTFVMVRVTFVMLSLTFVMMRVTFVMMRVTFVMMRVTFVMMRVTFVMLR